MAGRTESRPNAVALLLFVQVYLVTVAFFLGGLAAAAPMSRSTALAQWSTGERGSLKGENLFFGPLQCPRAPSACPALDPCGFSGVAVCSNQIAQAGNPAAQAPSPGIRACVWKANRRAVLDNLYREEALELEGEDLAAVACEGAEASAAERASGQGIHVAVLQDVFVNDAGDVFNATHHFVMGTWTQHSALGREFAFPTELRLHEVARAVNVALDPNLAEFSLLELALRLPLFLHLGAFMTSIRGALFILGKHKHLHRSLGQLLSIAPWSRTVAPLPNTLLFVKELVQPMHQEGASLDISAWRALRHAFLQPPDGLPLFETTWALRHNWEQIRASVEAGANAPQPLLPADWIVLVTGPPASLEVDVRGPPLPYEYPHLTLFDMARDNYWVHRTHTLLDASDRVAVEALARRAAVLVTAWGSSMDLIAFLPRGAAVVLLEPWLAGPPPPKGGGPQDPPRMRSWARPFPEAVIIARTLRQLGAASGVHVALVPCEAKRPADAPGTPTYYGTGPPGPRGLYCSQGAVQSALGWAADQLFSSGVLPGFAPNATLKSSIPGSRLSTPAHVEFFREWSQCAVQHGQWVLDPMPRRLPWGDSTIGHEGTCDDGFLAKADADAVAEMWWNESRGGTRPDLPSALQAEEQWNVRPGLKYRWVVQEAACGLGPERMAVSGTAWRRSVLPELNTMRTPWRPFTVPDFCNVIPGDPKGVRRIVLMGDSLTEQMSSTLVMNMLLEKGKPLQPETDPNLNRSFPGGAEWQSCWTYTLDSCPGGPVEVTYVRSYWLKVSTRDLQQQASGKKDHVSWVEELKPALDKADVVILNRGAHAVSNEAFVTELRASVRLLRHMYPEKLFFFRTTQAGSPKCTNHMHPISPQQILKIEANHYRWNIFSQQNLLARKIIEDQGMVYLDVYRMTQLRPDGHRGVVFNRRSKVPDCLHYCLPGPIDSWVEALYNYLRHLVRD